MVYGDYIEALGGWQAIMALYCGGKVGQSEAVLNRFAATVKAAGTRYREFVKKGIFQGKRPESSGGGLVRSAGGWAAVEMPRKFGLFQKANERISGDGDFVEMILSRINEPFEYTRKIKAKGNYFE